MVELHSLPLEEFLRTIVNDSKKLLEPHLQEAAVLAAGMRLEILTNEVAHMSNNFASLAYAMQGPIGMTET